MSAWKRMEISKDSQKGVCRTCHNLYIHTDTNTHKNTHTHTHTHTYTHTHTHHTPAGSSAKFCRMKTVKPLLPRCFIGLALLMAPVCSFEVVVWESAREQRFTVHYASVKTLNVCKIYCLVLTRAQEEHRAWQAAWWHKNLRSLPPRG
jgi:hypothetical protein